MSPKPTGPYSARRGTRDGARRATSKATRAPSDCATIGAARLAGPAGLAILFYARELWAATPEGERRDQRLLLEIAALVLATAAAMLWIGVGR